MLYSVFFIYIWVVELFCVIYLSFIEIVIYQKFRADVYYYYKIYTLYEKTCNIKQRVIYFISKIIFII
jgi:hypothetical protein